MSDLLIRGMELPTKGIPIQFQIWPDGQVDVIEHGEYWSAAKAHQVPPHGDLIDRDALVKSDRMVGKLMMYGGEYVYTQTEIDSAPAIIPASK